LPQKGLSCHTVGNPDLDATQRTHHANGRHGACLAGNDIDEGRLLAIWLDADDAKSEGGQFGVQPLAQSGVFGIQYHRDPDVLIRGRGGGGEQEQDWGELAEGRELHSPATLRARVAWGPVG
jgi:hypothetical protein